MSPWTAMRSVIADIYRTLFEVGPPPADAAARWETLWEEVLADPARLTLAEFAAGCREVIQREREVAIRLGVPFPEVYWPSVAREVLPELARLGATELDEFLYRHATLERTVRLMPGVAEILPELARRGVLLGLASNCQPYTLKELDAALAAARLDRALFQTDLCFFSFAAGFSKPDPHVFRFLAARLRARGVSAGQALVVGDRPENDLEPARAQGFQTWLLKAGPAGDAARSGDWLSLGRLLGVAGR